MEFMSTTSRIREGAGLCPPSVKRIIYWMQQAQRVSCNPALNHAIRQAAELKLPLQVIFIVSDQVPDARLRHYRFMLEGVSELGRTLDELNLPLEILAGDPTDLIPVLAGTDSYLVMDFGPLRWQKDWRRRIGEKLPKGSWCVVETDTVVPLEAASPKEEYAAATIRGKILKQLETYLVPQVLPDPGEASSAMIPSGIPHLRVSARISSSEILGFAAQTLDIDASVPPSGYFTGGYAQAQLRLDLFLKGKLSRYAGQRNDPGLGIQSDLSPYLHFGQISSLEVALLALEHAGVPAYAAASLIREKENPLPQQRGLGSFLEELIVRRELAFNFCHYNPDYDSYACVPLWARQTLNNHLSDPRPAIYSPEQLEQALTSDPYWNAAQTEMAVTGKMHNYMRMYWGKKIMEWTPEPESAFEIMIWLNNKYQLDGRDPNSYAGIAWCFGKHDRPWSERYVFGSVRYMNAKGLERKFGMKDYVRMVALLSD